MEEQGNIVNYTDDEISIIILLLFIFAAVIIFIFVFDISALSKIEQEAYSALVKLFERYEKKPYSMSVLADEIQLIYENRSLTPLFGIKPRVFGNSMEWLDYIRTSINYGYSNTKDLEKYYEKINQIKEYMKSDGRVFDKCTLYQQKILKDVAKLEIAENKMVINNLIDRIENEFIRQEKEIKNNKRINTLSLAIGIIGIILTIISFFYNK